MKTTPGSIVAEPHEHLVLVGPNVKGVFVLEDGTEVDLTPEAVVVSTLDHAQEIGFLVGNHFAANGHPDDIEVSDDDDDSAPTGTVVQRPFVHVHDKKFDNHPAKHKGKPFGTPRKPKKPKAV